MNDISHFCSLVKRQIQDPTTFTQSDLEDSDDDDWFEVKKPNNTWDPTSPPRELLDKLNATPLATAATVVRFAGQKNWML